MTLENQSSIDWPALRTELRTHFILDAETIHGPDHWERVERYGVAVAQHSGGDLLVVRLFAAFHDIMRETDGGDREHGLRAAKLAERLRGQYFTLSDAAFAQLYEACHWHTFGRLSDDPTIGACWDADRLDIWRAGFMPRETFMSTDFARRLVRARKIGPQYVPDAEGNFIRVTGESHV